MSWTSPPQMSWTSPPQTSWTSPPQTSWTSPPQTAWKTPAADVVDKPAPTPKESLAQAIDHAYHMDGFRDIFIPKKMKGLSPAAQEETLRQAKVSPEGIAKV